MSNRPSLENSLDGQNPIQAEYVKVERCSSCSDKIIKKSVYCNDCVILLCGSDSCVKYASDKLPRCNLCYEKHLFTSL